MEQQWRTYTFWSTWSIYPAEFLPQTSCLSFKAKWKHQGNARDRFFTGHGVCSPSMCVNTEEPEEEPAKPLLYAIAWGCFWFLFVSITSSLGKLENLCLFCSSAKGWGLVHEHPLREPRQGRGTRDGWECGQRTLQSGYLSRSGFSLPSHWWVSTHFLSPKWRDNTRQSVAVSCDTTAFWALLEAVCRSVSGCISAVKELTGVPPGDTRDNFSQPWQDVVMISDRHAKPAGVRVNSLSLY